MLKPLLLWIYSLIVNFIYSTDPATNDVKFTGVLYDNGVSEFWVAIMLLRPYVHPTSGVQSIGAGYATHIH